MHNLWLFLLTLASLHHCTQCLGLRMEISPSTVVEFVDKTVNISCYVETDPTVKRIELLEISKGKEDPIVFLQSPEDISYGQATTKRYLGEGVLDTVDRKNYLTLSIQQPRSEDGGEYRCKVFFLGKEGILKETDATGNVDVVDIAETYRKMRKLESKMNIILDKLASINETKQSKSENGDMILKKIKALEEKCCKLGGKDVPVRNRVDDLEENQRKQSQLVESLLEKESSLVERIIQLENQNKNQSQTIRAMEDKEIATSAKITRLESNDSKQMKVITALKNKSIHIKEKLDQLDVQSGIHSEALEVIKRNTLKLSTKEKVFETQLQKQSKLITKLLDTDSNAFDKISLLENLTRSHSLRIDDMTFTLAFCAITSKYTMMKVPSVVVFENVILQVGPSSYNHNTGVFVAPKHGLYLFSLYYTAKNTGGEIALNMNGNLISIAHTYEKNVNQWDQSGITTILELRPGDEVTPVVYSTWLPKPIIDIGPFSMFTGYLLKLM